MITPWLPAYNVPFYDRLEDALAHHDIQLVVARCDAPQPRGISPPVAACGGSLRCGAMWGHGHSYSTTQPAVGAAVKYWLIRRGDWHSAQRGQQRLGLATALCMEPKLLVLDEATSSLDADAVGQRFGLCTGSQPLPPSCWQVAHFRRSSQVRDGDDSRWRRCSLLVPIRLRSPRS